MKHDIHDESCGSSSLNETDHVHLLPSTSKMKPPSVCFSTKCNLKLLWAIVVVLATSATYQFSTPRKEIQMSTFMHDGCHDSNEGPSHHNKTTAVIHMGPHKTGTTSLQELTRTFMKELKEDGYYLPFDWASKGSHNQVHLASCFLPDEFPFPCMPELLLAGDEIAAEGKSMLVSAESFDKTSDRGQKRLAAYLTRFDQAIVVVFYRRYFEWKVSVYNQRWKGRKFGEDEFMWETSIVDYIEMMDEDYFKKKVSGVPLLTVLVDMLRKNFETLEMVNMHNGKDNNEEFFCEVMPNANRTCEALKGSNATQNEANQSRDMIYQDLAYNAMKQGMVQIQNHEQMKQVTNAVQKHQLETLGLTKDEFPLTCPSSEALDHLLSISLMMEESLFPEFYKTPQGEESLRVSFKKYSRTKLCAINADEALRDAVWIDFFKNFSY